MISEINNAEIMKNATEDFEKVQRCMILAKEEKAAGTLCLQHFSFIPVQKNRQIEIIWRFFYVH